MSKNKPDKQKLISVSVTVILISFFIGGFWIGLERVSSMEGAFPPHVPVEGITPAPENVREAEDFVLKALDKAVNDMPSVSYDTYFSIDKGSLVTDGSSSFEASLIFATDNFCNHISEIEENDEVNYCSFFGEDITDLIRYPDFENLEVKDIECKYIYYSCPSCDENSDEYFSYCEKCGSDREYFTKYHDNYEITIIVDETTDISSQSFINTFCPRSEEQIKYLTDSALLENVIAEDINISYNSMRIVFQINRLTDEIRNLKFIKDMYVTADLEFSGKYSALGKRSVSFKLTETSSYDFTWPSVTLNNDLMVIEPESTDNLLATIVSDKPAEAVVCWTSSDPLIASVDDRGYIKTMKNTGEATITASFEFLGKTYSDSCRIIVRVPVESLKINKKSVSLNVGEIFTLSTKVSPSDATVRTVTWYSEDEKIASVDKNGVVTAHKSGNVIIYALSDDGYYKSSCEVIVNE